MPLNLSALTQKKETDLTSLNYSAFGFEFRKPTVAEQLKALPKTQIRQAPKLPFVERIAEKTQRFTRELLNLPEPEVKIRVGQEVPLILSSKDPEIRRMAVERLADQALGVSGIAPFRQLTSKAATDIARSTNPKTILKILQKEVPTLDKKIAEPLSDVLVKITDPQDVQRVLYGAQNVTKIPRVDTKALTQGKRPPMDMAVFKGEVPAKTPKPTPKVPQVTPKPTPDPLTLEARKYKSAEEFVEKNIDDFVKTTPEYQAWSKGADNVIEAYHGTPYSFDEFKLPSQAGKQAGAYELEGLSFASEKNLAEPFSRQYPDWYYPKLQELRSKYPNIAQLESKAEVLESGTKVRSVASIKKEGQQWVDDLNKEWQRDKEWLYKNDYEKFRKRRAGTFEIIDDLKKELARSESYVKPTISAQEAKTLANYNKELQQLEDSVQGNVFKVYIKGKKIQEEVGEEIGFRNTRNQIVGELDGDILRIKDADTGQYIGEEIIVNDPKQIFMVNSPKTKSQLTSIWERANKGAKESKGQRPTQGEIPRKAPPSVPPDKISVPLDDSVPRLPAVIQGETFTMGISKETLATAKTIKQELKATQKEMKTAEKAREKADKLDEKQQKVRTEAMENIQRHTRGNTDNSIAQLKARGLSDEDIANVILEDGTKLIDTVKVKRNSDGSLSAVILKRDIESIAKTYSDEVPKQKWEKRSMLVEGIEIPIKAAKSIELPYVYFERKGLTQIYDPIIQAGRDAEVMKNQFLQRFKDARLYKEGSWFTADRFTLSKKESEGVAMYYLGRQGRTAEVPLTSLSKQAQKFVEIFDGIIKETEGRFFEVAKNLGKKPGKVENYAPIMTAKDIKLVDEGGAFDWLFRNHPAFFSLKERVKNVPISVYEKDYREVAARWLEGITQFLNYGETTNSLKYLVNSDQFQKIVKTEDYQFIAQWLKEITTPDLPVSVGGQSLNALSRLLRKGVALGALGLNYASVLKQALTSIPILIIAKVPPKLSSQYAKAFGIDVSRLPSITKRRGDIAIQDLQGKLGRVFTGSLTTMDKKVAQAELNGLLDKEFGNFLKEGAEISPEIQKLIEKRAQDALDMWFGGFFKGQRPEAFRKELGNFILMFLYPLTSQLNGFYRHILQAQGITKFKAISEVLAAVVAIAYMEQVIENLSPQWSDEKGMTEDILLSAAGNIPLAGNIAYSIINETEFNASPVIGNINNIFRAMGKGDTEKTLFSIFETGGLPKQVRRIREGLEIMEEGGITDNEGKMLAPVQDSMELVRSFLRGKYGSNASRDWVRNIGEKSEDRRWFVPQVEFLQNGDYDRKAELYKSFSFEEQVELKSYLSEAQQKKLDKALGETSGKRSMNIQDFGGRPALDLNRFR